MHTGECAKIQAMQRVQRLKTYLPILLLVFTVSGAVNAKVVSGSQHLTPLGSDTPAGGLVGEDLESAITAGIRVERFNRQLHLKEAIALKGEKDRIEASDLSAKEKEVRIDKLEAVSCHFVRCSEGVSEEDAGYKVLAERQAWGAELARDNDLAYQAIARHYHNGLFVYTDTDRINDFLTRHEEGVARTLGAGQSLTATIGMVGGVAFTVASAPTCPTSGVGCALTVGSVIFTGLEAARFIEGLSDIFGDYELSSGQKVLTSFDDPENHPGDVNPLGDVLKAAGISVVEVGVGKLLVKTSSGVRAVIDRFGRATKDVPSKAKDTLAHIKKTGSVPPGYKGGRTFKNDGRGGGQRLPQKDASGNAISYTEYDVNPYQKGVNRGTERLVRGSDGKSYYTNDHYKTFTPIE